MANIIPKPVPSKAARGPYETIAAALRDEIRLGQLKPGDQLPTVAELAAAHMVAVGTAHRAMALLKDQGLIEATRGRRATVAADPFPATVAGYARPEA
jgi:DNA-binding GntR family transcriptional regulator